MMQNSSSRFREIVKVFSRYGLEYIFDKKDCDNKRSPENLRKAFEELGPTFIKIGQILSTRPDILPRQYIDELVKLQDSASEETFEVMINIVKESINEKLEDYFISINPICIAAASIAQVYEGTLVDGREVIIKIQRPEIYKKMQQDLSILIRIIKLMKKRINISEVIDPVEVLEEIKLSTQEELDFTIEACNINKFREYNKNVVPIYAPYVVDELVSSKVIVLEKIKGFKINCVDILLENGYDTKDIAKKLALSYCKQIFEDGFFHGDPHPGNILISEKKICFIDFGIMGQLSSNMKHWLSSAMAAIATKDKEKLVECILSVSIKRGRVSKVSLYDSVSYLLDTYLATSIKNIKLSLLLQEILNIARHNNIQLPKELITLTKGMIILEGVVSELDPELEIIDVIISFMKSKNRFLLLKYLDTEEILVSLCSFMRDSAKLPTKTIELFNKIYEGKAQVKIKIRDIDKIISEMNRMVNRITEVVLIAALMLSSSLIVSRNVKPTYKGVSIIGLTGYLIAAVLAILLLISTIKSCGFCHKDKK